MSASRTYDLSGFDSIEVSTGVRAMVTTGQPFSVRVEARDDVTLDRLDVSVVGGRLHIGFARNFMDFIFNGGLMDLIRFVRDHFSIVAHVSLPTLNGAEANAGARIEVSNVKSDRLRIDASSGAEITLLALSGGDVRAQASSGARVELEGTAGELDGSASSGGQLRADRLSSGRGRRHRAAAVSKPLLPLASGLTPRAAATSAFWATLPSATSIPLRAGTSQSTEDLAKIKADARRHGTLGAHALPGDVPCTQRLPAS